MARTKYKKPSASVRERLWLQNFLDRANPDTFFNIRASALRAGWSEKGAASAGYRLKKKFQHKINLWLNEDGLSDESLDAKLIALLDAKKTKFFAHKGVVLDERNIQALDIQIKALDMAYKLKGRYAAKKHEVTTKNTDTPRLSIDENTNPKEAERIYAELIKGDDNEVAT
jgi:hypothetical protein